uniref:Platelet-derived growth factor (PDGF) family profile domain-containing protein n=1 Tax=Gadus morhua TaxID=8049 RepID=A0A8C5FGA2_GADMO
RLVLEELQRTACRPREVCVEVSKEAPEPSSRQYLPRCVALHRCGGCCHHEGVACTNTSHHLLSPLMERLVVTVTFVNHTSCECVSKRPLRAVIRRHAITVTWGMGVHCVCVCVCVCAFAPGPLALCGPRRALDDASCECVCRNGLTDSSCEPGWRLDHDTCESGSPRTAPSRTLCGCVCAARCPGDQPLNPDTCLCQCRESPQSCLRQGKRFNTHTCSCYRLPCRKSKRGCPRGFYYSSQVCQCIPTYMRPAWN